LAEVISEPIFDISRLVEAARHQRFDPLLGSRTTERSDARVPPGAELDVRRQAGVDEAFGVGDRPFVELGDPGGDAGRNAADPVLARAFSARYSVFFLKAGESPGKRT
jgi:hypothetical protein